MKNPLRLLPLVLSAGGFLMFAGPLRAASDDPAITPARVFVPRSEADLPAPRDFQGIPGVAVTPGGTLWAVWYGGGRGEGPWNYAMLARSADGGETWSNIAAVIDHPHEKIRTYDPVVWTAPDGALWVFYAQAYSWWDGRAGVWAITCADPDAETPQWSTPRRLADGIMMNKPTVLKDGRWLLPVAMWSHVPRKAEDKKGAAHRAVPEEFLFWDPAKSGTKVVESRDGGKTFAEIASIRTPDVRFDEHMFVERKDGSLWLLIRGKQGILESASTDGGKTWSEPRPASIPHIHTRFFIRRLVSGALLLVRHQTPEEKGQVTDDKTRKERSHLTAWVSDDDGKTWQGALLIDERKEISYPDGDQLKDGTLVLAYDFSRGEHRQILLARFTEEDVRAGKFQSPGSGARKVINQAPSRQ